MFKYSTTFVGKPHIDRGRLKKGTNTFRLRRRKQIEGRALKKTNKSEEKRHADQNTPTMPVLGEKWLGE